MNQTVTLENIGIVHFRSSYKLIWYNRETEIFTENEFSKSYKIQLFFENGKSIKDYVVMSKSISNVDVYIKDKIDCLMISWLQRCNKVNNCMNKINVVKITK